MGDAGVEPRGGDSGGGSGKGTPFEVYYSVQPLQHPFTIEITHHTVCQVSAQDNEHGVEILEKPV
jgi:hypothetical protein